MVAQYEAKGNVDGLLQESVMAIIAVVGGLGVVISYALSVA